MKRILTNLQNEIWQTMPAPFADYQISIFARCRRADSHRELKPFLKKDLGYYYLKIKNKNLRLHRLVAQLFVPNPDNLPVVNHIDGNKANNNASNLEWVTHYQNVIHAVKHHLRRGRLKRYDESLHLPFDM